MLSGTQLLKVRTLIRFEEHDSIQEAIVSSRRQMNAENSRRACDQLEDETIEAVEWSDSDALFRFANSKSMRVFVTPQGVEWAVDDSNRIEVRRICIQGACSCRTRTIQTESHGNVRTS